MVSTMSPTRGSGGSGAGTVLSLKSDEMALPVRPKRDGDLPTVAAVSATRSASRRTPNAGFPQARTHFWNATWWQGWRVGVTTAKYQSPLNSFELLVKPVRVFPKCPADSSGMKTEMKQQLACVQRGKLAANPRVPTT